MASPVLLSSLSAYGPCTLRCELPKPTYLTQGSYNTRMHAPCLLPPGNSMSSALTLITRSQRTACFLVVPAKPPLFTTGAPGKHAAILEVIKEVYQETAAIHRQGTGTVCNPLWVPLNKSLLAED